MSNGVRTLVTLSGIVTLTSVTQPSCVLSILFSSQKAKSGMVVKALPERLRLTYLLAVFIASAILGSIGTFALIVTLIGLSGLLAGWLSRYFFKSSTLFMVLPPPLCPKQSVVEKMNIAKTAKILAVLAIER